MIDASSQTRSRPLTGLRVLVTRASSNADELSVRLQRFGAETIELATIQIEPNPYPSVTAEMISRLSSYDWLVFTSARGVETFLEQLDAADLRALHSPELSVAAVGDATASRLREFGVNVDLVPERFDGDALLDALRARGVAGKRVLMPRAEVAREDLPVGLQEVGAMVDVLPVYRTVPAAPVQPAIETIRRGEIDIVTFASSSSVHNLIAMLGDRVRDLAAVRIACIGPITAATVREYELEPWVVAETSTIAGLVDAICNALER